MSAHGPASSLLRLLRAQVTKYPPVTEPEGVGHCIPNVGPTENGQGDPANGVEDGNDLRNCSLGSNVSIA